MPVTRCLWVPWEPGVQAGGGASSGCSLGRWPPHLCQVSRSGSPCSRAWVGSPCKAVPQTWRQLGAQGKSLAPGGPGPSLSFSRKRKRNCHCQFRSELVRCLSSNRGQGAGHRPGLPWGLGDCGPGTWPPLHLPPHPTLGLWGLVSLDTRVSPPRPLGPRTPPLWLVPWASVPRALNSWC